MQDTCEAYQILGLSDQSSLLEADQRYHSIVRRLRAKELQGYLTMLDELQMKSATQAYRYLLDEERNKIISAYRMKKYGRFRRFSRLAECLDEFFYAFKIQLIGILSLCLIAGIVYLSVSSVIKERAALAALPIPDLTIMIGGDLTMQQATTAKQQLAHLPDTEHWADIKTIETMIGSVSDQPSELPLYTQLPDVYLLDQSSFIKLLQVGYVRKLEEWDSYGVDLNHSSLRDILSYNHDGPLIAAMSINAPNPERASSFIRYYYDKD